MKKLFIAFLLLSATADAQTDSLKTDTFSKYNLHFQQTLVEQYHPDFHSDFKERTASGIGGTLSGGKSLYSGTEKCMSSTSTLYLGVALSRHFEFYFNPEVAAGQGFSGATGIAGFPNGETFRVGDPGPSAYIARAFLRYTLFLNDEKVLREEDQNIMPGIVSSERIIFNFGKYSISDFFDQNITSHDPKTSLMNWSLMDGGAWDYSSNTRGYTYAANMKVVKKKYIFRFSTALNSLWSNGPVTHSDFLPDYKDYLHAHGETAEIIVPIFKKQQSTQFIKLMVFANRGNMALYSDANAILRANPNDSTIRLVTSSSHLVSPVLDNLRGAPGAPYYGKYGCVVNWEKNVRKDKIFVRGSWNDGKRETWMYTEIDESLSFGTFLGCDNLKRPDDKIRIAVSINGISKDHMEYLREGGYGFIIGDGYGNYQKGMGAESVLEMQYNYQYKFLNFTPDIQIIANPGYNCARGPVSVFSFRAHMYL